MICRNELGDAACLVEDDDASHAGALIHGMLKVKAATGVSHTHKAEQVAADPYQHEKENGSQADYLQQTQVAAYPPVEDASSQNTGQQYPACVVPGPASLARHSKENIGRVA